jgi:hypothetical protein
MRCAICYGTGSIVTPYPCPDCGGTGIVHCCDGDVANDDTRVLEDICIGSNRAVPAEHGLRVPIWIGGNR